MLWRNPPVVSSLPTSGPAARMGIDNRRRTIIAPMGIAPPPPPKEPPQMTDRPPSWHLRPSVAAAANFREVMQHSQCGGIPSYYAAPNFGYGDLSLDQYFVSSGSAPSAMMFFQSPDEEQMCFTSPSTTIPGAETGNTNNQSAGPPLMRSLVFPPSPAAGAPQPSQFSTQQSQTSMSSFRDPSANNGQFYSSRSQFSHANDFSKNKIHRQGSSFDQLVSGGRDSMDNILLLSNNSEPLSMPSPSPPQTKQNFKRVLNRRPKSAPRDLGILTFSHCEILSRRSSRSGSSRRNLQTAVGNITTADSFFQSEIERENAAPMSVPPVLPQQPQVGQPISLRKPPTLETIHEMVLAQQLGLPAPQQKPVEFKENVTFSDIRNANEQNLKLLLQSKKVSARKMLDTIYGNHEGAATHARTASGTQNESTTTTGNVTAALPSQSVGGDGQSPAAAGHRRSASQTVSPSSAANLIPRTGQGLFDDLIEKRNTQVQAQSSRRETAEVNNNTQQQQQQPQFRKEKETETAAAAVAVGEGSSFCKKWETLYSEAPALRLLFVYEIPTASFEWDVRSELKREIEVRRVFNNPLFLSAKELFTPVECAFVQLLGSQGDFRRVQVATMQIKMEEKILPVYFTSDCLSDDVLAKSSSPLTPQGAEVLSLLPRIDDLFEGKNDRNSQSDDLAKEIFEGMSAPQKRILAFVSRFVARIASFAKMEESHVGSVTLQRLRKSEGYVCLHHAGNQCLGTAIVNISGPGPVIEFPHWNLQVPPTKGSAVFFPAVFPGSVQGNSGIPDLRTSCQWRAPDPVFELPHIRARCTDTPEDEDEAFCQILIVRFYCRETAIHRLLRLQQN